MIKYLAILWATNLRYRWSNFRHRTSIKFTNIRDDIRPVTIAGLAVAAHDLYSNFEHTPDGATALFDSINTPAESWKRAFSPGPLEDDCDGFHGALYWAAHFNLVCCLLTLVTKNIKDSHTLLIVKKGNLLHFVDYIHISRGYESIFELVENVRKRRDMGDLYLIEFTGWNGSGWESINWEGLSMEEACITEEEREQLKDFKHRDNAIYKMVEKLTAQQHQLEIDQEHWFAVIRDKYNISAGVAITIKHDTGEICTVEDTDT